VADSGILGIRNLIIVGDLKIVLSTDEVLGGATRHGSSYDYYRYLFFDRKMIDIKPKKMVRTWQNGRSGNEAVARRLDRCLVF